MMKMCVLLVFCILVPAMSQPLDPSYTYEQFCSWTNCTYTGEEYEAHKKIFTANYAKLREDEANDLDVKLTIYLDWN